MGPVSAASRLRRYRNRRGDGTWTSFPFIRVVALDVHQAVITACAIIADEDGVRIEERSFETFKRGLRALRDWCLQIAPEVVVMESTGIYWKSPHAWLERAGLNCMVVNAHHVKNVPGRKTDIADPRWLAMLARAGLAQALVRAAGEVCAGCASSRASARSWSACWRPRRTGSARCWPTPASASAWW